MKYLVVIVLSLVPLVAVTVGSFVDLAKVDDRIDADAPDVDTGKVTERIESARSSAAEARQAAADFAEQDLLRPRSVASPETPPQSEELAAVYEGWAAVVATHRVVAAYLRIEKTIETGWQKPGSEPLQRAVGELEKLKQNVDQADLPRKDDLLLAIDQRIEELTDEIALRELKAELADRLAAAQKAFDQAEDLKQRGEYDQAAQAYADCRQRCREALDAKYADVRDPTAASQVRSLDGRAEFYAEYCVLRQKLQGKLYGDMDFDVLLAETARQNDDSQTAAALASVRDEIARFLDRHRAQWQSTAELTWLTSQHQQAVAALGMAQTNTAAKQQTEALVAAVDRGELPDFTQRLDRMMEIVRDYPTPAVKTELRDRYSRWLGEAFPEKQVAGLDGVQEIETNDGRIVQGYFKPWPSADAPQGYQRYESRQEALNPSSRPGVIELSEIRVPPHEAVPAGCVRRYNAARLGLIAGLRNAPGIKQYADQLAKFVKTCEDLEQELAVYRAKAGSMKVDLSFAPQGELARRLLKQVLESPEFEALLGPLPG